MQINRVFKEFHELQTERFILRQLTLDDTLAIFKIFSDPEVTKYYDVLTMKRPKNAAHLIQWWINRFKYRRAIRWGITYKGSSEVIGTCGFSELDKPNYTGEIGFDLRRDHWGQGVMTEVAGEMVHFGFNSEMKLNRIETWVIIENRSSIRVLEKIGFKSEGVLHERRFWGNRYFDVEMFALLRKDYYNIDQSKFRWRENEQETEI